MGNTMDVHQQANGGTSTNVYKKSDAQKANETMVHFSPLTHKQMKMHGCVLSTVATDALVLKHQAISIHIVD